MDTKTLFPNTVKVLEHVSIPLSDGTRLAARIWMPDNAEENPVPSVFEFIPYRKRDFEAMGDSIMHPYFAGHGYACVRVDLRGAGESEGVLEDEYLPQEQKDALEVLEWIADQNWCDGNIGMIGISWGGFNGLQVAALQPPQLKAVITACSTDDRYTDDIHYMGGCLLGDHLSWSSVMFGYNSLPPDPALVGDKWKEMWKERLEESGLWLKKWLDHQHRDEYWKHGSICEDYSAIQVPVFALSGWADGYSNAVFRMMHHLEVPRLGLVGPWSHMYPHLGKPGPAIGFLQEALRWWDQWLKNKETGIMEEPMLRTFMQDSIPPSPSYEERPGRWVGEDQWPPPDSTLKEYLLDHDRLVSPSKEVQEEGASIRSPLSVGLFAGKWCSYSSTPDLPHDQREEDGGALVFTSAPLEEDMEILGAPYLDLEFSVDQPVAMVAVRLSDIQPDDKATRVTYGVLNLTHREGHENPMELEVGRRYKVCVRMNDVAQRFPKGHRLRLSVSTSYFPLAWPAPEPFTLTLFTGNTALLVPERKPKPELDDKIYFEKAEGAVPTPTTRFEKGDAQWKVERDLATDASKLTVLKDDGTFRFNEWNWTVSRKVTEEYSYQTDEHDSVKGEVRTIHRLQRGPFEITTDTHTILTSDKDYFYITAEVDAYEGDERFFCENWKEKVKRELV